MAHIYGVPWRFAWSIIIPLTCLREMTRKSSFSRFMAVLMSYCPLFWGSRAVYNDLKNRYMFESYDQKLVVFVFWPFSCVFSHCFCVPSGFARPVSPVTCLIDMTKNSSFSRFMTVFMSISHSFGFPGDLQRP